MRWMNRSETTTAILISTGLRICEGVRVLRIGDTGDIRASSENNEVYPWREVRETILLHKIRYEREDNKEYYKYDSCIVEDLLSATALELTEVTRTRDDRESSSFGLDTNYYYDDDSEDHEYDVHIYEMRI